MTNKEILKAGIKNRSSNCRSHNLFPAFFINGKIKYRKDKYVHQFIMFSDTLYLKIILKFAGITENQYDL